MSTTAPPPGQLPVPGHSSSSSSRRKDAFAALPAPMSPARLGGGGSGLHSSSPSPSPTTGNPSPSLSNRPALTVDVRDQRSISDKRLPSLPAGSTLSSPGRVPSVKPWALGAYDNKLVSSTLSHLPPLPPLSPGGMSTTGSNISGLSGNASHLGSSPGYSSSMSLSTVHAQYAPQRTRTTSNPSNGSGGSGVGMLVLPDGTKLPVSDGRDTNTMHQALSHSSPNSPWSLLTVHVLPVFAGSPLKTPLEDLNNLCNSHILATSQRVAPSRLVATFTADLRDFIASGMLTLNAKFETLEEAKIVARAAEVWNFFWGQILPYVEGVFLPFSQVRDVSSSSSTRLPSVPTIATPPIPVRQILLSGFLVHILLPLLPRLIPLLSNTAPQRSVSDRHKQQQQQQRGATDLPRLLQMSLVLATQAKYSAFFPMRDPVEADEETRDRVEQLARAVRWRMGVAAGTIVIPDDDDDDVALSDPEAAQQYQQQRSHSQQHDDDGTVGSSALKRGPSVSQAGRLRPPQRGGSAFHDPAPDGHGGAAHHLNHQTNPGYAPPDARWRIGEMTDDEDDAGITPSTTRQSTVNSVAASAASTATTATGAASTVRGAESFATITDQRTPQDYGGRRRHDRTYSSGESDLSSALSMLSRGGRKK